MFEIHQYTDDIEVYKNHVLYLKVSRKFNLLGKLSSVFRKGDIVILESTYDVFLFRKSLSIKHQNLAKNINLLKSRYNYILQVEDKNLILKRHYFKNPLYTVEDDSKIVSEISTKINGLTDTPIIYTFDVSDDEFELYYLIRFLIEVPPVMDV
jgi:hypothetical protein